MTETMQSSRKFLRHSHEILFCLNSGFAIALALILFLASRSAASHGKSPSGRLFLEVIIKIEIFAHLHAWENSLAFDVMLTGFTILFFLVLLLVLRFIAGTRARHAILNSIAGMAALAAVPVVWFSYQPGAGAYLPADLRVWYAVALEFAVIGGALYLTRKIPKLAWFIVLVVHYSVWFWALRDGAWSFYFWRPRPDFIFNLDVGWPIILSIVSPCAGFVWALYVSVARESFVH
ncbi:MAG: hypothetical protein WA876_11005 [Candidatus Acidiferrales bacterium]